MAKDLILDILNDIKRKLCLKKYNIFGSPVLEIKHVFCCSWPVFRLKYLLKPHVLGQKVSKN